jgi:hypothetical protein
MLLFGKRSWVTRITRFWHKSPFRLTRSQPTGERWARDSSSILSRFRLSLRHHKNVFAVHDGPVATLPIPVAVLVGAPVSVVPVGIGMDHCGAGSGLDCGSGSGVDRVGACGVGRRSCASLFVGSGCVRTCLMYRRLSATFFMSRCAVLGVDCRPVLGMNRLASFAASLTSVGIQGRNGDQGEKQ